MPITITPAAPGGIVGPGLPLLLSSSFIGPVQTPATWRFQLSQDDSANNLIYQHEEDWSALSQTLWPYVNNLVANPLEPDWALQPGATVYVSAQLREQSGQIDQGSAAALWDPTTGLANVVDEKATGGLTDVQALQLQNAETGVTTSIEDTSAQIQNFPLAQYFGYTPPPELLVRSAALVTLRGEFDQVVPIGSFGFIWAWTTVPAGIGVLHSVPNLYDRTMLSISEVHTDRSRNQFVSQYVESRSEGIPFSFNRPQPDQLHFRVCPGVTGVGQWLQLLP